MDPVAHLYIGIVAQISGGLEHAQVQSICRIVGMGHQDGAAGGGPALQAPYLGDGFAASYFLADGTPLYL